MSDVIVAKIDKTTLTFSSEQSDRFVYSNYFVPVLLTYADGQTPILPFYMKQTLLEISGYGTINPDRMSSILTELGVPSLWQKNAMDAADKQIARNPTYALRKSAAVVGRKISRQPYEPIEPITVRGTLSRPTILDRQDTEFIAGLLQSDVGFVFLDRTRVRPVGFALGEHVYALGLAPSEEVVLEQKTFTKRQLTLEEQNEQEKQFDIELSSTLSTEIQEGFDRQRSLTDTWGLNMSHTGQYSSPANLPWGQINASHTIGYTKNVTDAQQETARRSVKDSQTASSKVAAKYRTQHKTDFKLSTEQGLEATSKRTIRNPNRTSPITLHYFKILQRLQMSQERYGARLCWAPSVKDPARTFFEKIQLGRERILQDALLKLPPQPIEPKPAEPASTATTSEKKWFTSPLVTANQWGLTGDMRANYDVDLTYDTGFSWDGDVQAIKDSLTIYSGRPDNTIGRSVVGLPYPIQDEGGNKLRVRIHIGAPSWVGGPGIDFQFGARFTKEVTITQQVGENTKYNDDLATYRTLLKEWTENRDAALVAAQAAADEFQQRLIKELSPINEMVSQIIEQHFPASVRDECWEIDYWQRIFDWERATFLSYPSWWSTGETRDPALDPSDYLNASWAKLYLPVRAGMEYLALRWIFGKKMSGRLQTQIEDRFDNLVSDLRKFRGSVLGAADEAVDLKTECQEVEEKFYCLAKWNELMPTDGTHLEVVQGITTAADAITRQEIDDASSLRTALVESEKRTAKIKDRAMTRMTKPANIDVEIGVDMPPSGQQP